MTPPTGPRWQKPVGMLIILALIAIWCVGIVSLAPWIGQWHPAAQLLFYVAAGVVWLWVLPMRRMLSWMETGKWRADRERR
ncbi:DUF2842 domain-containing protein [Sphingomonas sp.]|uniref:DUF2842 domain-containing protein n=1 Tax=Sphingomonas sp. TaxID=28214 RepID=UPI0025EAE1B4|nr:DUF2842 domain-containing protein [Sphingomonas sp.]